MSADLKKVKSAGFIQTTASIELICNAITSVVAPDLYRSSLAAIQALQTGIMVNPDDVVQMWPSVWSGISVIVNRKTPYHRDWGGAFPDYDLLVSAGTHGECFLDVPDIGGRLLYLPGTAVAISGKLLRHGVLDWRGGERVCNAHFMKDAVHEGLDQPRPDWPKLDDYWDLVEAS